MKLIGVGFGRSGTMSIKQAIEDLGEGPCFHMIDLIRNPDSVGPWHDAVIKGNVDLDAMFAGYKATIDWPGCTFWRELIDAYPDVPVLLNYRDFEGWHKSMTNTVYDIRRHAMRGELTQDANRPAPSPELWQVIGTVVWDRDLEGHFEDFEENKDAVREIYERRIETLREEIPSDRLVEFELGVSGWPEICGALGVEEPDREFPHLHDTDEFRAEFGLPPLAAA